MQLVGPLHSSDDTWGQVPAEHGCVQVGQLTMDHALLLELRGSWLPTRTSAPRSGDVLPMQTPHPGPGHGLSRILVRFDTARIHLPRPATHAEATSPMTQCPAEELCRWLQRHGLQEHHPVPLKGKPTSFVDIQYLDDQLRVHIGESGTVYGEWREQPRVRSPSPALHPPVSALPQTCL
jgi:hypothetical protein